MKVNSINQFRILKCLETQFNLEVFQLELIDDVSVQLTDAQGQKLLVKYSEEECKITVIDV